MRKTPKYSLEFALMADGVPADQVYPTLRTPRGVDRAFRKLDEIKPNVVWWSSISQVPDLLGSREVVMSVTSPGRSEEHTSELQSLMRISYAVFCLENKKSHESKD